MGDRAALQQAWERDGYWYFKGVLDLEVIGRMREVWLDYMQRTGLIDGRDNRSTASGSLDSLVSTALDPQLCIAEFNKRHLHKMLTEDARINATMKQILGDDPFWLPIAEYRATPPGVDPAKSRLVYPHQDGFYSRGMPMKICWIPIDHVSAEMGGCTWVGGAHRGPILHDINNPPLFPIPQEAVPVDGWLRADYAPGDIVIFDLNTPHSGLTNISKDRFRLSMDIRVTEASGPVPAVGNLVRLTPEQVTVRNDRTGVEESYAITAETYVRSLDGKKREGADIPSTFQPGELILVNAIDGRNATLVRSTH
jgi:ectoine hydroxylase-related dioxygenase (phytanoyl-CoA dioxygenase family)